MHIQQQTVLGRICVNIHRRHHPVLDYLDPALQGIGHRRVRVLAYGHLRLGLPLGLTLRAYARSGAGLYDRAVLKRGLRGAEAEVAGGGPAVADVLEFVEVGVGVVPEGAVEFLEEFPFSLPTKKWERDTE